MINKIDETWTLFLDRDGVINKRPIDDYVRRWDKFEFLDGVLESIATLSGIFGRIVIVTNQAGIGKGLMTEIELRSIHIQMVQSIYLAGGRIDRVYYCPNIPTDNSLFRKPYTGMGFLARAEYPEIDFERSVMVGDSISDMQFGKKLGMKTVFIEGKGEASSSVDADSTYTSLAEWLSQIAVADKGDPSRLKLRSSNHRR
jgi:D-glycero-D-manno-heptose 1,7-bisphosphate phosphatase